MTAEPWGQGWRAEMPRWYFPQSCQWGGNAQVAEGMILKSKCSCMTVVTGKAMVPSLRNKDCWTGTGSMRWSVARAPLLTVSVTFSGGLWSSYLMGGLLQFEEKWRHGEHWESVWGTKWTLHVPYAGSMTEVSISSACTQMHRAWERSLGGIASLCTLAELLRVTKTWWDSSHIGVLPWIDGWIQAGKEGQYMQRRGGSVQCFPLEWVLSLSST